MNANRITRLLAAAMLLVTVAACTKVADDDPVTAIDLSDEGALQPVDGTVITTTAPSKSDVTNGGTYTETKGSKLPVGWPKGIEFPAGVKVTSTSKAGNVMVASGEVTGANATVFYAFRSGITGAGYQLSGERFTPGDGGGFGTITGDNSRHNVSVYIGPDSDGDGSVFSITVGIQG